MTLREIRKSKGLKLKEVSNDLNMPLSSICKYELGQTKITPEIKEKFCKYYGVKDFDDTLCRYYLLQNKISELEEVISSKDEEIRLLKEENERLNKNIKTIKKSIRFLKNVVE